jgi:ribose transport system substrate-binding protein
MQKSASAYERHQTIINLIQEYSSVRVTDLAEQLNVSESTIRNDLETLDEQGYLVRIHGGAIANPDIIEKTAGEEYFSPKALNHADEKRWIARWAAGMVEDGDVIMLDASTTVLHIAPFLADRRNLSVFTNGIDVARVLAKEPTNTVIVLGGILRPNGNSLTGSISKQVLEEYQISTAFLSCSGFTPEHGFFEVDMQEAEMKKLMMQAADKCIALLDFSKIGRVGIATFASLNDMDYFITDDKVDDKTIEKIYGTDTHVVVCGEQTTRSHNPHDSKKKTYRVGFANLSEHTAFSRDVRRGLEKAAEESQQIELIVADNQLDPEVAMQVADELLEQDLDLVIEYQIDEMVGNLIAHKFQQANIPMIAVDIPMLGAVYFGVDNLIAGQMGGKALGKSIQQRWNGEFDHLIILEQQRAGHQPAMRIQGQLDGLQSIISNIPYEKIMRVDSDNTMEGSYRIMQDVFDQLPLNQRIAIICFNDDAAMGAFYAAQDSGHASNLLIVGQGADRRLRSEMRNGHPAIVGSTAFRPEDYGNYLTKLALAILSGESVPPAVYMEHFFVSPALVDKYYPRDTEE